MLVYNILCHCRYIVHLSSGLARWRMRVWRLSAALCGRRAAGAENNGYRPSSLWQICTVKCIVSWYKHDWRLFIDILPKSLLCLERLARHSRGEVQPASIDWYRQSEEPPTQQGTYSHSTPGCRSLHNRRGLWPASNKRSANAAPSASSSKPAPTPPQRHRRCSTLRCRLATQHPPRASAPVRLLSRTVSVLYLALKKPRILTLIKASKPACAKSP